MKNHRPPSSLHDYAIPVDGPDSGRLKDHSVSIDNAQFDKFEAHLRDQEQALIQKIVRYKEGLIVGCVAWLTSLPILTALARCKNVQILVQKEDFLRPDVGVANTTTWKRDLAAKYAKVKCEMERHQFGDPMGNLSYAAGTEVDGIRCVGNYNRQKLAAMPRSHHKFLVFCRLLSAEDHVGYLPEAVWTGSFNFTKNAMMSFENAVFFSDKSGSNPAILAFLKEHHQLFGLSEPLNWTEDWVTPEYRIGT
jgi:hypothetical protein